MPLNILVIGGTRFVGYELTWRLLAGGHRVTLFNRGLLPDPFGSRLERLRGDRTTGDFARLLAGRSFDAAVDFLAFRGEEARQAVSVLGGRVGHYVMISSGQVYLVRQACPEPAREADYEGALVPEPSEPADREEWAYGMGKRACENALAEAWAASHFPSTRLRIPMVNGERDHKRRLETYIWRLLDGGPIVLPDGGRRPTRHVYAGAVARAIIGLLERPPKLGQAWNLAQEETPTLAELLEVIADLLGAPARLVSVPAAQVREAGLDPVCLSPFSGRWMSFIDPGRAQAELGFRHEPLRHYLDKIVASFLAHTPAAPPVSYAGREAERRLAQSIR